MSDDLETVNTEGVSALSEVSAPSRVVAIGASAGGLEAFSELLRHLPKNTGMSFVFIQHLEAKQTSRLTEILSRITEMPVEVATDGQRMQRDRVYVMPPGLDLTMSDGILKLEPRTETGGRHLPIDHFFRSLAREQGIKGVAVILSGMGSDGTAGLKIVKESGGMTFAQDELSAQHQGMPRSAVDSGVVDVVAAPGKIAEELGRLAINPTAKAARKRLGSENSLRRIFILLRAKAEVDFSQYRKTTVRRRIQRRMVVHRLDKLGDYLTILERNPDEVDALYEELLIHVTHFFREPETFEILGRAVLPRLLPERGLNDPIRIWLPGCSTGEEAYSLAIAVTEFFDGKQEPPGIQIFATDVSERVLAIARKGIFDQSIESNISKERLRRFFSKIEQGYQVKKQIRDLCVFARQNVLRDPPFSRLDLISCRNVLIYFEPAAQKKLIPYFHYALKPGGFLLLGGAETVGNFSDLFEPVDQKTKLFSKRPVRSPYLTRMEGGLPDPRSADVLRDFAMQTALIQADPVRETDRLLMAKYCPPAIVVDSGMRIVQFRGNVSPFLDPEPGEASLDLFRMVRTNLEIPLRSLLAEAKKGDQPARKERILAEGSGLSTFLNIEVVPMSGSGTRERWFVLLFEDSRVPVQEVGSPPSKRAGKRSKNTRVSQIEQELAATREHLQTLIEEQESVNEELRSANEEIQSSNEELQSTNEELETAKEELQSTNEELITLNEELKSGNVELSELNNDLTNLLRSVNIPIVMVDRNLRIRRFTPVAQRTLKLITADVGRAITDLRADVEIPQLEELVHEVMETLSSKEIEIQDRNEHWYRLQIRPYETADNKITGAVLILFDINSSKRENDRSKQMISYAEAFVETVRNSVLVLDRKFKVEKATSFFYEQFRLTPAETEGLSIYEIGAGQWNIPGIRTLLGEILPQNSEVKDFEIDHEFHRVGRKRIFLNVRCLEGQDRQDSLILISIGDS
jgi:two-component system, chemotaxis family, CheB/CheR fusion protein